MNFPLENEFYQFIYWLLNTAGLGGIMVTIFVGVGLAIYALTLTWIVGGAQADERETYAYPTPALHHREE